MSSKIAVVAHFDVDNRLDESFAYVLLCLEMAFDVVVLVTTSDICERELIGFKKTILIKRPNIGYDFYSYRVGFEYAIGNYDVDCVLFTNSSFFVTDEAKFSALLTEMIQLRREHEVVAFTESLQFNWHIQSYLILLSNGVVYDQWTLEFIRAVEPLNTKFEIILNYEIGFSNELKKHNIDVKTIFQPGIKVRSIAKLRWLRIVAKNASAWDWLTLKALRSMRAINWTHFAASNIAQQFGIVKTEVLRTNPHGIDSLTILSTCSSVVLEKIGASVARSKLHYRLSGDGLSTLVTDGSSLPSCRSVQSGPARMAGVRVAVVIHLFYYDLFEEIRSYLVGIVEPFDLYITTPFDGDVQKIIDDCGALAVSVTVRVTENKGRDIGPFMSLYLEGLLDDYVAVLKLHSKKSKYSHLGDEWRKAIYSSLMRDSFTIRKILDLFDHNNVGVVGPHEYYLSHENFWGANRDSVTNILKKVGSLTPCGIPELGFFAGSMFWFSPKAIMPLKKLSLAELVFPQENGMQDGTLAHALERIFCPIARSQGYITTSLQLQGLEINTTDTKSNKVPVL